MRSYETKKANAEEFIGELFQQLRVEAVSAIENRDRAYEKGDNEEFQYADGKRDAYVNIYDQIKQWFATGECTTIAYYDETEDGVGED